MELYHPMFSGAQCCSASLKLVELSKCVIIASADPALRSEGANESRDDVNLLKVVDGSRKE